MPDVIQHHTTHLTCGLSSADLLENSLQLAKWSISRADAKQQPFVIEVDTLEAAHSLLLALQASVDEFKALVATVEQLAAPAPNAPQEPPVPEPTEL